MHQSFEMLKAGSHSANVLMQNWLTIKLFRSIAFVITAYFSLLPLLTLILGGALFFEFAHEFIAYRIGQALSIAGGEAAFVRPVQGITNAIVSSWIVSFIPQIASFDGFQAYSRVFMIVVMALLAGILLIAWFAPNLSLSERLSVSLFTTVPWYVGGASMGLLLAPDYWIFEYLWLAASLFFLFRPPTATPRGMLLLGLWIGLGIGIKIGLLGVSIILVAVAAGHDWRSYAIAGLGAAVTYLALLILYSGAEALNILLFQIQFYLRPNQLSEYADWTEAFGAHPVSVVLTALALLAVLMSKSTATRLSGLLAVVLNLVIVLKRPHDTSITSVALSFTFIAAGMGRIAITASVLLVTMLVTGGEPRVIWTSLRHAGKHEDWATAQALSETRGTWLTYENWWNSTLLPLALGYNGALVRPNFPNDRKIVFKRLFPGSDLLTVRQFNRQPLRLDPVFIWTEPVPHPTADSAATAEAVRKRLGAHGYALHERAFRFSGRNWLFVTATRPSQ